MAFDGRTVGRLEPVEVRRAGVVLDAAGSRIRCRSAVDETEKPHVGGVVGHGSKLHQTRIIGEHLPVAILDKRLAVFQRKDVVPARLDALQRRAQFRNHLLRAGLAVVEADAVGRVPPVPESHRVLVAVLGRPRAKQNLCTVGQPVRELHLYLRHVGSAGLVLSLEHDVAVDMQRGEPREAGGNVGGEGRDGGRGERLPVLVERRAGGDQELVHRLRRGERRVSGHGHDARPRDKSRAGTSLLGLGDRIIEDDLVARVLRRDEVEQRRAARIVISKIVNAASRRGGLLVGTRSRTGFYAVRRENLYLIAERGVRRRAKGSSLGFARRHADHRIGLSAVVDRHEVRLVRDRGRRKRHRLLRIGYLHLAADAAEREHLGAVQAVDAPNIAVLRYRAETDLRFDPAGIIRCRTRVHADVAALRLRILELRVARRERSRPRGDVGYVRRGERKRGRTGGKRCRTRREKPLHRIAHCHAPFLL